MTNSLQRFVLAALALVTAIGVAAILHAQTVDSYSLKVYDVGATTAKQTTSILKSALACNLTTAPPQNTTNPSRIVLNDPVNTGKFCTWTDVAGGPLLGQPAGSYELTLTAVNGAGTSAESTRAPFLRLVIPLTPTGVYVAQ